MRALAFWTGVSVILTVAACSQVQRDFGGPTSSSTASTGGSSTGGGSDGGGEEAGTEGDGGAGDDGGTDGGGGADGGGGTDGGDAGDAGGCGQGLTACGNACVDEQTDPAHCGSCSTVCNPPVSGSATGSPKCGGGSCDVICNTTTPLACAVTLGHACVNPLTDPQYCNGCGTHCPGGQTCKNGACVAACGPKLTSCSGSCVNLQSDPNHCGTCTTACSGFMAACKAGNCMNLLLGCTSPLTACTVGTLTACVDTATDPTHFGACTTACAANQVCVAGNCKPYIFVSAGWECGNGNAFPVYCQSSGLCVGAGVACP